MLKPIPQTSNRILPSKSSDFPSGLVLHYDMQDLGATRIMDKSGMGNHGDTSGDASRQTIAPAETSFNGGTFTLSMTHAVTGDATTTAAIQWDVTDGTISTTITALIASAGYTNAGAAITATCTSSTGLKNGTLTVALSAAGITVVPLMTSTSSLTKDAVPTTLVILQTQLGLPLPRPALNGYSRYFDGVDDVITKVEAADNNLITGSFTISVWVKFSSITSNTTIIGKNDASTKRSFLMFTSSSKVYVYVSPDGSGALEDGNFYNTALENNTWYHIIERFNADKSGTASNVNVFVNSIIGVATSRSITACYQSDQPIYVARKTTGYFNGNIADVKIFNRALADTEIKELYQNEAWRYGLSS